MAKRKTTHARRKSSSRGQSQPRDFSGMFSILLTGVVLGLVISFGVHLYRSGKYQSFGQGLGKLYRNIEEAPSRNKPEENLKQEVTRIQPKYEYYNILLKNERPIPRFPKQSSAHNAKSKPNAAEAEQNKDKPGTQYVLQVAAFREMKDAEEMKAKLAFSGLMAHIETINLPEKGIYHRVRLGPYSDMAAMNKVDAALESNHINATRLAISQ